ncbi:unnamed protein product [Thelazia callipaeda]|uniref:BED-type domain-containing protein n=1 Tax=Thelazia callipaeda TaxID=103827 RepID=A0A0N5CSD4_THECL|nr:unnamed protein product [Thelazia callipaeda]
MSVSVVGVYDHQQIPQNRYMVVGKSNVISNQEISANGITNDVTYEAGEGCRRIAEASNDSDTSDTTNVLEIGKRRSVYLASAPTEQYGQEEGCSVPKIARNDKCMENTEHLMSQRNNVYRGSGAELVTADDDGEHQTLHDISRCAPREITYEPQECNLQHCNMQQQHCSVHAQHCDVQELPLSNQRVDREVHSTEKNSVKNEIDSDETASHLLISLSNALTPSDAEFIDRYRPKGRPKHPVWNFFKFYKSGGLTLGYMCLLCGNGFTGPPNTTNATKHLRCKHKHEYLLYFDLLEGSKQGTFFGDVHQSIRELVSRRGVKTEAPVLQGNNTGENSRLSCEVIAEGTHRNHGWTEETAGSSQDADLHSFLCSALVSNTSKNSLVRYDVSNTGDNSEVSSSGEVVFAGSSTGDVESATSVVNSDATGQFAGQVESFLKDYRRLEVEVCFLLYNII